MSKLMFRSTVASVLIAGTALVGGGVAGGQSEESASFEFTGEGQSFTVPADVCSIEVDAFGAAGNPEGSPPPGAVPLGLSVFGNGVGNVNAGGLGGHATAPIDVTPGEGLSIYVGGQGQGGGGGDTSDVGRGGDGGGTVGEDGEDSDGGAPSGDGGTQIAGGAAPAAFDPTAEDGALGIGGAGGIGDEDQAGGGGGGGGYYGGGGGAGNDAQTFEGAGGGGGSGFGPSGVTFETGVNEGDGSVNLTWTADPGCDEGTTTTASAEPAAVRPTFTG